MFIEPLFTFDPRLAVYINEKTVIAASSTVALAAIIGILIMLDVFKGKNHFDVYGKTLLLTGASSGMGLSVAQQLSAKGANIAIVARDAKKLEDALALIKSKARSKQQRFASFSADLTSASEATRVIDEVTAWNNGASPDTVWTMAGSSDPRLFIETTPEILQSQMQINYFATVNIAHAILKQWLSPEQARKPKDRHLIFTATTAIFTPIVGYSPYSPCKAAMKSLCDTLAQEVLLYTDTVKMHCVCPGSIDSPGFVQENINKPAITKKLEEPDPLQSSDDVAKGSIRGLESGEYLIVTNFFGKIMRSIGWGSSRRSSWIFDTLLSHVMNSIYVFIKWDMDGTVRKWGKEKGHPSLAK